MKYKTLFLVRRRLWLGDTPAAFPILAILILVGISNVAGCHAAAETVARDAIRPMPLPQFVAGIVTRSADLNYISEQDSEVFAFYRNTPVTELTDSVFLGLVRRPAETDVTRQSWSTFFKTRTQQDPTGRWRHLQEYLEANLKDPTVLQIRRDEPYGAQYDLYAVGIFNGETVVGVQMFGVAT